jgi:hypothetical protein
VIAIAQRRWLRISSWEPSFCKKEVRELGGEISGREILRES